MNSALEILVSLTVAGSVVIGCLLLLRLIPASVFPAKWRYFLGKVALAFFLVPTAFFIQWLLLFLRANPIKHGSPLTEQQTVNWQLTGSIPEYISASLALTVLCVWAAGFIVFSAWQLYCYCRFTKELHRHSIPVPENSEIHHQLLLMKQELGMKHNVQLVYSSAVRSPALVGLWQPTILLPLESNAHLNISMVLHHELIHLKRLDLAVKALVVGASALHWFNPFVHLLRNDIHKWSELSCDEEVVKDMSFEERKQYGATILNAMEGRRELPVSFCTSLSGNGKQLKRRLIMMLNVKKRKMSTIVIATVTAVVIGSIGTATAVWAATNTPEVGTEIKGEGLNNITIQSPDNPRIIEEVEGTEVKLIPIEEATEEQIREYKATFEEIDPDSEFWSEVEENPLAEIVSNFEDDIIDVEAQEVILVEVEEN